MRPGATVLLAVLGLTTVAARGQDGAQPTPFRPQPGERWLVEVAEVTTRSLTFAKGERALRQSHRRYQVELEAPSARLLTLNFRSLSVSRPGLAIDATPRGLLHRGEDGVVWIPEAGSVEAGTWVKGAFSGGLPEVLGAELLPPRPIKSGERWVLKRGDWRGALGLEARGLASFRGVGRCDPGPDGGLRLSIRVDFRPQKLGALELEPGAQTSLRIEAGRSGSAWWSKAELRFEGRCSALPAGPGRTRRAAIRFEQSRSYRRSLLP